MAGTAQLRSTATCRAGRSTADGQGWDTATVKVDRRAEGWPAEITLSASSRLTRRQAIALAEALLAAAGSDAPECDGFVGGNAWGACAACGRRLEDHTA